MKKASASNKSITRVSDRLKRINLKSKRKRNLIKKAIELSKMCDLDITIIIKDRELDKIIQYSSGIPESGTFTPETAMEEIKKNL